MPHNLKLGKLPAKHDPRTLCFTDYASGLAAAPAAHNQLDKVTDLGMMLNDKLGDCTCAGVGHIEQVWTAINGRQFIPTDKEVEQLYEQFGYVPGEESSDNGANELDVLNYWRQHGAFGRKLIGFANINPCKPQEVKDAVFYFGASYIGFNVPAYLMPQDASVPEVWDVEPSADNSSLGGHAVPIVAYDEQYAYVISWGKVYKMTWAFLAKQCDEAHVPFGADWIGADGKCPCGFDQTALLADLHSIVNA